MPPRLLNRESNSDSEGKLTSTSRAANKARNAMVAAAQLELLSKHINSNGPQDQPKPNPIDLLSLDEKALHNYNRKYRLKLPYIQSINENILNSEIGKKTYSAKKKGLGHRVSKQEFVSHVQKHFNLTQPRENDIVSNFLYKVKNEERDFKFTF